MNVEEILMYKQNVDRTKDNLYLNCNIIKSKGNNMKNVKSLKDLKNELGFYYEVKTIDKVSEG